MEKRKGAQRISDIPPDVLQALNEGRIESVNLVEWLAVDQEQLLEAVLPALGLKTALRPALDSIAALAKPGQLASLSAIATTLLAHLPQGQKGESVFAKLATHPSDIVRSWAVLMIGLDESLSIEAKLFRVRPFAADANSGLRETAWMAVRPAIEKDLPKAIRLLTKWTLEKHAYLRRFASESTRPRGVWCRHIEALKVSPELGMPVLEPLHNDSSKYVRDSVANWLNDASKSRPDWVRDLCAQWETRSPTAETAYIVKRALRTLNKNR